GLRMVRDGHNFPVNEPNEPIRPGDALSIDAGLSFIGYHTDLKRSAYVLRPGETEPPAGIRRALAEATRVTDVLIGNMRAGRLGHQAWDMTMGWVADQGYQVGYAMG